MLIFGPETCKLLMETLFCLNQKTAKVNLTREQISIESKVAFLLVRTAFMSLIFDILLELLFFFWSFFFFI